MDNTNLFDKIRNITESASTKRPGDKAPVGGGAEAVDDAGNPLAKQHEVGGPTPGNDSAAQNKLDSASTVTKTPARKGDKAGSDSGADLVDTKEDKGKEKVVPNITGSTTVKEECEKKGKEEEDDNGKDEVEDGYEDEDEIPVKKGKDKGDDKEDKDDKKSSKELSEMLIAEGFKPETATKTVALFEAAVTQKVNAVKAELLSEYNETVDETIATLEEMYSKRIDQYMTFATEEYLKENKLSIENAIKYEIAENFINNLKKVFVESYIDIPETKVDVVKELLETNEKLVGDYNKLVESVEDYKNKIVEYKKGDILESVSANLTQSQIEKFAELTENVTYVDDEQYMTAIVAVKEKFIVPDGKNTTKISEDVKNDIEGAMNEPEKKPIVENTLVGNFINHLDRIAGKTK